MPAAFIHKLFLKTKLKSKCTKSGSRHICKLKKRYWRAENAIRFLFTPCLSERNLEILLFYSFLSVGPLKSNVCLIKTKDLFILPCLVISRQPLLPGAQNICPLTVPIRCVA